MDSDLQKLREYWIEEAVVVLSIGKGHLGVINMLRGYGMSNDSAMEISYDIFDHAKLRLLCMQRSRRLLAWCLIVFGMFLPLIMLFSGLGIWYCSFAPIGIGVAMLFKLPNPTSLPRKNVAEQGTESDR